MMPHTVTVQLYQGHSPHSPAYALGVAVRCFVEERRRLVRDRDGREVMSETTLYMPLDTPMAAESRVTVNGRVTTVIIAARQDGAGMPVPSHLQVHVA